MQAKKMMKVGMAQISPVWLNRDETIKKVALWVEDAGKQGCALVAFGEALIPGYPFWVELTNSTEFDSPVQKELFACYVRNAVQIESGDLDPVCKAAADNSIAVYLGIIERAADRGGHSLYCTLVFIDATGTIQSAHRKLMPTYEERLVWSIGDGNGLKVHKLGDFTVGGLNCWENWMPLPRTSLYAMGEDLHVAVWPGSAHNTRDITRFIAHESRSYVVSVGAVMNKSGISPDLPHANKILLDCPEVLTNGGSCIAGPDGEWVVEPNEDGETLIVQELDHNRVLEERQNFDPSGHYSRPDVFQLEVDLKRQQPILRKNS